MCERHRNRGTGKTIVTERSPHSDKLLEDNCYLLQSKLEEASLFKLEDFKTRRNPTVLTGQVVISKLHFDPIRPTVVDDG